MAVGSYVISGTDQVHFDRDLPSVTGMRPLTAGRWTDNGNPIGTDKTDGTYPAAAAWDGHMGSVTRGNGTQQVWWFTGVVPSPYEVDGIFLHVPSYGGDDAAVTVYLSDTTDASGDVELEGIDSDHFDSDVRLFAPALSLSGDAVGSRRRFTGALYVKVRFDAGAGNTCWPHIGELVTCRQRQLSRLPLHPYSEYPENTSADEHVSAGGVPSVVVHYAGAMLMEGVTTHFGDTTMRDYVRSMWDDAGRGTRNFIWCLNPATAPGDARVMRFTARRLDLRRIDGPYRWEWVVSAEEAGGSLRVDE